MDGHVNTNDMMARIEAQVNAQMSEVFREQVTDKCFVVCADVSKKQMSARETDCVDRYVLVKGCPGRSDPCLFSVQIANADICALFFVLLTQVFASLYRCDECCHRGAGTALQ